MKFQPCYSGFLFTGLCSTLFTTTNQFVQAAKLVEEIQKGHFRKRMLRDDGQQQQQQQQRMRKQGKEEKQENDYIGVHNLRKNVPFEQNSFKDLLREFESVDITMEGNKRRGNKGFTAAKPIDYFRNQIDPTLFEWFNEDEVQPGAVTCGYLYPKLGVAIGEDFPTIQVKFCMSFNWVQPAEKGNLAVHCGGPGSLSDCIMSLGTDEDFNNLEGYNLISFDQRGMGMSWPSFAHEECTLQWVRDEPLSYAVIDTSNQSSIQLYLDQQKDQAISCWACQHCDFHLNSTGNTPGKTYHFLEYSGTRQVAQDLDLFREAIGAKKLSLYGVSYGTQVMATYATMFPKNVDKFVVDANMSPRPDLRHMAAIDAEMDHQRLSYLAYTCTIQNLTHPGSCPINMNQCFNDVFDFYKEIFDHSGGSPKSMYFFFLLPRLITPDLREFFFFQFAPICDAAQSRNETEFVYTLMGFVPFFMLEEPCLSSALGMFDMLVDLLDIEGTPAIGDNDPMPSSTFAFETLVLGESLDNITCTNFNQTYDTTSKEQIVHDFWEEKIAWRYNSVPYAGGEEKGKHKYQKRTRAQATPGCNGPTLDSTLSQMFGVYPYLYVFCNDFSIAPADESYTSPHFDLAEDVYLVHAQSQSGSTYDDRHVIKKVQEIYDEYGGAFYGQIAATRYLSTIGYGYFWPQAQPIPPSGDTTIKGIVSGQLYDPATSYEDTQDMKSAFPGTTLVTSQWVQHGLGSAKRSSGFLSGGNTNNTCQDIIDTYFLTGQVPVVDGFVCGSTLPDPFEDF